MSYNDRDEEGDNPALQLQEHPLVEIISNNGSRFINLVIISAADMSASITASSCCGRYAAHSN